MTARPPFLTPALVRVGGAASAVLLCGALAACSGTSSTAPPTSSPTAPTGGAGTTVVTTTVPAPTPSSDGAGSGTPSSGNGGNGGNGSGSDTNSGGSGNTQASGYCKESQLRAQIDSRTIPDNNTNGEHALIVDFINKSGSSCVLYGYPGAAIEDSSNHQVQQATRTLRGRLLGFPPGHDTLPHVTLQPGALATAGIEGTDQKEQGAAQAGCDGSRYPRILVTPPNTRIPVPFSVGWPLCYSFTVHPVNLDPDPAKPLG